MSDIHRRMLYTEDGCEREGVGVGNRHFDGGQLIQNEQKKSCASVN